MILSPSSPWVSFRASYRRYSGISSSNNIHRFRSTSGPSLRCSCSPPPLSDTKSTPDTTQLEEESVQCFSVLASDDDNIPWEDDSIWSTFGLYMFCLHIPLSFGGLSFVSHLLLHQPLLHPQTQVLSLVALQMVELSATIFLLSNTAKPQQKPIDFLKATKNNHQGRNWLVSSALGLGCIVCFIFLTSLVADQLFGSKVVESSELENIMASGVVSRIGCVGLYCVVAPIMEEIVYRRFLLSSLASTMEWRKAVVISSLVFAASHLSGESSFLQLFGIGCVLGGCYSWSGNLASSLMVHSLYNALTLLLALRS
ncbi:unnamed protein product [Cochlearia groenlandica]